MSVYVWKVTGIQEYGISTNSLTPVVFVLVLSRATAFTSVRHEYRCFTCLVLIVSSPRSTCVFLNIMWMNIRNKTATGTPFNSVFSPRSTYKLVQACRLAFRTHTMSRGQPLPNPCLTFYLFSFFVTQTLSINIFMCNMWVEVIRFFWREKETKQQATHSLGRVQ